MPDSRPLRKGDPERLGDYRITGLLGEGGQGVVYLGERLNDSAENDGEFFAIKLLRTHLSADPRARRYFARELAAAQRIDPSFTARIVEADVEGQTPYIVSEYVAGAPLSDTIRGNGPLAGDDLMRLAVGTLNALSAIHQANVVHRDFKPSNVLLSADRPRVIDFGIARALDSTQSMTSGVVGTPSYMAPEQLDGRQVTPAVDVFAWGATMVFAATGSPPFGQDSIPVVMQRILHADPNVGAMQSPLRELVWYCLYKHPGQRPTTEQLLTRLNELMSPSAAPLFGPGTSWSVPIQPPSQWQAPMSAPSPWGTDPNAGNHALPPAAPPPSHQPQQQTPWPSAVDGTTRPPEKRTRRWLPVVAVAAGVALIGGGTALAVDLLPTHHDKKTPPVTSAAVANAALTKVVNPSTAKGGTLKLQQVSDFDSLDPVDMYYTGSWNFSRLYVRSLMTYKGAGTAGLRPIPDLAAGAGQASSDLKTWTYRIRTGVKFEDGTPVTAKDVKYAVARTFASDTFFLGPRYFPDLLDAGSYAGPYKDRNLDDFTGVTTPDDQTVVFHLKKPYADFDYLTALPQTAPVPSAKDTGIQYKNHPVATGPYKLESSVAGKSVSLVRNPQWTPDGIRTALPDRIEVTIGSAQTAIDQQLLNGGADANPSGTGLGQPQLSQAFTDPNLKKNTDTTVSGFLRYVAMSTKVAPFDNIHCRLAVQYAADRTAVQSAYGGANVAEPATNTAPPNIVGRQSFDLYPTSADKAKQELSACNQPNGFTTKLAIRQDRPKDKAVADVLQQTLAKIGITVQIVQYPVTDFYTKYVGKPAYVHENKIGMIFSAWGPDYPTATGFYPLLVDGREILSTSNNNMAELNDSGINGLLDQANQTGDRKTREGVTAQLDRKVMGTGAVLPLLFDKQVLYRNPRLTNATVSQMYGGYDLVTLGVG